MIPLGSCTMKLNAATEMAAVTWPEFADLHPFAPAEDVAGSLELIGQLEAWLADLTGYDAVSLQPNAGSQGELAGLLAIRGYHRANGDEHRTVCLIPSSAHGTNAASAVLAGMKVVVVACDELGNVDLDDLRAKIAAHADDARGADDHLPVDARRLRARGPCRHATRCTTAGGQVYIDGANLNALLGHARFGDFGGDVSHLNLHKTFCIPHGGGGPGVGPVAREGAPRAAPAVAPVRAGGAGRASAVPAASAAPPCLGGALRVARHPADLVGLRADDGRRRPARRDRRRRARRELRRGPPRRRRSRCCTGATAASSRTSASSTCGR